MSFIDRVLEAPTYGWERDGKLSAPPVRELLRHTLARLNVFRDRRNWVAFSSWFWSLAFAPFLLVFLTKYFSLPLLAVGLVYAMVVVGSHGTIWFHRYSTHRAYQFRHPLVRFAVENLVPKVIINELYTISHHVHHARSEQPGDPYNAQGGFFYCFLADVNHQPIARDLSRQDYGKLQRLMSHTGVRTNSYERYLRWGSLARPLRTTLGFAASWAFWYGTFFLIGGHALATALFGCTFLWAVGIRTFNYDGHGKGKDKRKVGYDLHTGDRSINQVWPGLVAGEWHNNHHLFPRSARTGFLPSQPDGAWFFIRGLEKLGLVHRVIDDRERFLALHRAHHARLVEAPAA
ncbi:fatty acid desaturase [Vulgatibacter sp.]|uniref:fatty acid desaturase n=1 Tax=Vulgatibacter sp. TaxID=1971226 RepID=UPI00356683D8